MSLRVLSAETWTPTAAADTADIADGSFLALQGGSSTQRVRIDEIYMGGQATTSAVNQMLLGRDSTVGSAGFTLSTDFNDQILDGSAVALATAVKAYSISSATQPQRDVNAHLLALSFNAFGGIVRWVANQPQGSPTGVGNTASLGEMSLSAGAGTPGAMSTHVIYEPY